ncbi:hypothetical protein ACN2C7_14835 [Caulobacter sp. ErkDOM-E]|uniref:hypothetical protein n=1 Tax=Caulobacter sp. ErkDOM-E TaxID=3402778 RepID=UPI003AF54438
MAKFVSDHASQRLLQAHKSELDQALESHKSQLSKETETHKLKLKREELIFQREVEAAQAFMSMWRAVWPRYRMPDMDWDDACSDAAEDFGLYEKILEDFLEQHTIAISDTVRQGIESARSIAAREKFFTLEQGQEPPTEAVKAAGEMLDLLKEAQNHILKDLRR